MTVTEYRKRKPNCDYCRNRREATSYCNATGKRMLKRTAKKCPCYVAMSWHYENEEKDYERNGGV